MLCTSMLIHWDKAFLNLQSIIVLPYHLKQGHTTVHDNSDYELINFLSINKFHFNVKITSLPVGRQCELPVKESWYDMVGGHREEEATALGT